MATSWTDAASVTVKDAGFNAALQTLACSLTISVSSFAIQTEIPPSRFCWLKCAGMAARHFEVVFLQTSQICLNDLAQTSHHERDYLNTVSGN
ncbi:MAG TPA: hypothetical protein DCE14_03750, partial [Kosmotogaceae bacterium]|nr:hypothetical protein [Kosmotogaceae bacterium]